MPLQPLPAQLERALVAPFEAAFLGVGADADIDAAFDDATETAWYEYGRARIIPSVASIDAGQVTVVSDKPVSRALAVRAALAALASGELEGNRAYALALTDDAAYKRRRVNLTLTDPTLDLGAEPGMLGHLPDDLVARLLTEAGNAGSGAVHGEELESVEVRRLRARYKPVATAHRGASASSYAVLTGDRLLSTGHATATVARRTAVDTVKSGPLTGAERYTLGVVKLTRRADTPLVTVERVRIAQRASLRLTFAARKNPGRVKHTGWLFFGRVES